MLTRGLLYIINRTPIQYHYDDVHYDTLKQRQQWADKHDTHTDFTVIPVGSIVLVQREDSGPWMYGRVVDHGTKEHNNKSYKIYVMKTGCIITCTACQIKETLIPTEQYLHDELTMVENQCQGDNDFNRFVKENSMAYTNAYHTQPHT